jgi:hypothetical protein
VWLGAGRSAEVLPVPPCRVSPPSDGHPRRRLPVTPPVYGHLRDHKVVLLLLFLSISHLSLDCSLEACISFNIELIFAHMMD